MADDIASVGIKIETRDIDRANVSLDTLAGKGVAVDKSLGKIEGAAAKAGKSLDNLGRGAQSAAGIGDVGAKAQHAAQGIRAVGDSAEKAGRGVKSMATSMGGFGDALSGIAMKAAAAAGAFVSVNKAFDAAAQWTDMSNRLKMVADGTDGLARAQAEVVRIAQSTRAPLEATAQLYQRIAQQQDALGMSTSRVAGVVETVSKAMALSGVSAGAANAALVQFGQALASGVLRGDELNSILEQAPGLAMALAEGLGTTTGKLREMGAQGQLTADMVVGALEKQANSINQQFDKMAPTISQALGNVNTAFTAFVGKLDEATGLTAGLARTIDFLAKNFDTLAIVLGGTAIVGAVAAFGGLTAVLTGAAGAAVLLAGALLTPIGLAVAAVAGLTAAYIVFKDELNGTGASAITLGDIFGQVGKVIAGVFGSAQDEAKKTGDASADAAENTVGYWEKGIRGVAALMDKLASVVNGTMLGIGQAIGNVASAMTDVFAKAFNWIAEKAESFINSISRGVNSVTGLLGVNPIGAVSFGRAAVSGVKLDVGGSFDRGMQMGQSSYWGDMAGGFIDSIRSQKSSAAAQAAASEAVRAAKANEAKTTRELAEAEERLEQQRIKSLKIDKEYQQTLKDLVALREAGRISEAEYVKKVEALATATYKASAAGQEAAKSAKDRKKSSDEAAKEAEREAKAVESFIDKIKKKIAAQELELKGGEKLSQSAKLRLDYEEKLRTGALKMSVAEKARVEVMLKQHEVQEAGIKLQQEQAKAWEKASQDYDKYVRSIADEAEKLDDKNKATREEIDAMGLTARQLAELEKKRLSATIAAKQEELSLMVLAGARDEEVQAILRQIAALEERKALIGEKSQQQEMLDAQKEQLDMWQSIDKTAHDVFVNIFEDGAGTFKRLGQTLKAALLDMLYQMTVKRWIINIGASMSSNPAAFAQAMGGGGSLGSNAMSAYNLFTGVGGNMGAISGFFGGTMSAANAAGSLFANMGGAAFYGDGLSALLATNGAYGTAGSGIGSAMAGAGVIALPLIVGSLFEKYGNSSERITGAATTGTNRPSVNIGSGSYDMLTGNLPDRQALIDRLVGYGATAADLDKLNDRLLYKLTVNAGIEESMGREGGPIYNWRNWIKDNADLPDFYKGPGYANPEALGWWSNDYYNGKVGAVAGYNALYSDPAIVAASRQLAESIVQPFNLVSKALGETAEYAAAVGFAFDPDKKNNKWWAGMSIDRDGQSIAEFGRREGGGIDGTYKTQEDALRAMFKSALGAFNELDLPNWARTKVEATQAELDKLSGEKMGEEAAALYQKAAVEIAQTISAIQTLINVFPDFSSATQDSVHALGLAMGGLDNLASSYQSYLQNFYTTGERNTYVVKQMQEELDKVNMSLPSTNAAFRDLVEAQDLNTEEGRKAFAALMNISTAFAEVYGTADAAAGSIAGLGDELAAMEPIVFGAASDLASVIEQGLLGTLTGAQLGEQMADVVMQGMYSAIAGGFSQQITALMVEGVLNPMIAAAMTGASMSDAVSQAAIDRVIQHAQAAAAAINAVLSDPGFQAAIQQVQAAVGSISVGIQRPEPIYDSYAAQNALALAAQREAERMADEAQRLAQQAAQEAQRAADEEARRQQGIMNERLGLTKQLLQLEGNTVLLRQIELEALDPSNRALQQRIWAIEDETAAAEKYKSALKDAQDFLGGFTKNIEEFIFKVSHAQADAQQSYQMAAAKFTAQMTLARGGDRDAMNGITGYADTLIGSIRRESTTGAEANLRIARVLGQLASLPKQISAEQLIVDAIVNAKTSLETVLSTNFASLDANVDGLLTADELAASGLATNTQISALMARVDANGDGMISKQELANSRLQTLATEQCTTNTNLGNVTSAQNSTNSWLSQIQMADVGYSLSNINAINSSTSATVAAINKTNAQIGTFNRNYDNPVTAQFSADSPLYSIFKGIDETNTWLYKLHGLSTASILYWIALMDNHRPVTVTSLNRIPADGTVFADGGYTGPGAKWQPAGVVHKGEVVWSQADVARWGGPGIVDALRQGAPGYADGGPVAVRVPQIYVPPVGRSNEETQALLREVLAELRAQRSDDRARHSSLAEPLQRMDRRGAKWDRDGLPAERTNEAIA